MLEGTLCLFMNWVLDGMINSGLYMIKFLPFFPNSVAKSSKCVFGGVSLVCGKAEFCRIFSVLDE